MIHQEKETDGICKKIVSTYIMLINFFIYIPGTQMSLVLIGKDLVLEAKQRTNGFQVYIYISYTYIWVASKRNLGGPNSPSSPATSATTTTKAFVESPEIVLVVWKATYVRGTGGGVLMA